MKKLLLFLFLFCTNLAFGQTGVRVKLTGESSVTFPLKPVQSKTDSNTIVYSANQNGAYYIVSVKDLHKQTDVSLNDDSLTNFYDNLVNNTLKKSNAKLVSKKTTTIDGVKGVEFEYTVDNKSNFPDTRFQQSVFLNKKLISYSFWTFKDKLNVNAANKDIFFSSISKSTDQAPAVQYNTNVQANNAQVQPNPGNNQNYNGEPKASRIGYSIGYIIGAILFIALLLGIFVMIKKTLYKKK